MKYNLNSAIAPTMPKLGKGTECIQLLISKVSPDMHEAIVPMIFPALAAYSSGVEFMYPDRTYKELCGMMCHLVADSGMGKGQFSSVVEAIMRKFRQHDEEELAKLVAWQKQMKTKGANKEKPERPDVAFWFPPADITNPAFIQNSMALEKNGNRTMYINMPEIEMADRLCGGHKQVSQTLRNIYDRQRAGALRATADGVSGNPLYRANLNFSSTPVAARKFYKYELFNGTFGRVYFSYKARENRDGRIPRQGKYSDEFLKKLDVYLERISACQGRFIVEPLNKLADQLANDMATLADLADDDVLWDISKRSVLNAWKCGCLLYVLNNQTWSKGFNAFVEWLAYYDLWSKTHVFGDMLKGDEDSAEEAAKSGPKNMLDSLDDSFSMAQIEALRTSLGKDKNAKNQLNTWTCRGFITYDENTGLYSKTEAYLARANK